MYLVVTLNLKELQSYRRETQFFFNLSNYYYYYYYYYSFTIRTSLSVH